MRRSHVITAILLMALVVVGCGSDAGDRAVLQFLTFQDPGNDQPDVVNGTSAQVDVFPAICEDGSFEPYGETSATALFINNGGSDILLDTITIDIPNSGVGTVTQRISSTVIGGRCGNNVSERCASDADCTLVGDTCFRQETPVTFQLVDLLTKATVEPGVYNVTVTFEGEDLREEGFTVRAGLSVTFANFDNCETTTS